MRQRLSHLKRQLREKCPRVHKIIKKSTDIAGWTPIILSVYAMIVSHSYKCYKSKTTCRDSAVE